MVPELGQALGTEPVRDNQWEGLLVEWDAGRPKKLAQAVVGNVDLVEDELTVLGHSKAGRRSQFIQKLLGTRAKASAKVP